MTGTDCGQVVHGVEHSTEMAAKIQPRDASIPFVWGLDFIHQNQNPAALTMFKPCLSGSLTIPFFIREFR